MIGATDRTAGGRLLREWRRRRNLSQMELALGAAVSARHLSFIETGRARPSREMVLHLADRLDVPLRDRNRLLLASGHAPAFPERDLSDPEMAPVHEALGRFLAAHEPFPALVVDRRWDIVRANAALGALTAGVSAALLEPPVNALRVSLHPDGMAPRIANLGEWSGHLLHRLRRVIAATGDADLAALHDELAGYPGVDASADPEGRGAADVVLPLRLRTEAGELSLLSTVTVFGTALDVTLAELSVEAFYPADAATAAALTPTRSSPGASR